MAHTKRCLVSQLKSKEVDILQIENEHGISQSTLLSLFSIYLKKKDILVSAKYTKKSIDHTVNVGTIYKKAIF